MSWIRPRELLATFGADRLAPLSFIYVFCLSLALVVGTTQLRATAAMATVLWTVGALVITLVARKSLVRFRASASEIRLPDSAGVLQRSHAWLLGLTLVVPILLFWRLIPEGRYWICLTLLAPLGVQVATLSSPFHSGGPSRLDVGGPLRAAAIRSSSQVISMFIGRAYAPLSVGSRAFTVRVLYVVLWSVPLGLLFNSLALVWTEVYVALTAVATWMWFLQSLGRFVRDRPASYAELALLPGLGSAAARRRGLYWAVLAPPLLSVASLIGIGLLAAYLADHSAGYALLLLYCAVGILQLLFMKRTVPVRVAMLLPSFVPLTIAPTLVGGLPIDAWSAHSPLARVFFAALLLFTVIPLCLLWIYAYGLARSPHPFLEITSPLEPDN
jgi:hypothetical protein